MENQTNWTLCPNVHHKSGSPTYAKKDEHGFTTYATLDMLKIKQLKTKQLVKHVDGVTGVVAKVFITSAGVINLYYRLEGVTWSEDITIEQALKYGIIKLVENKELVNNTTSVLVEKGMYNVGDNHNGFEIAEVHDLTLTINDLGVIEWHLYKSAQPHHTHWMNGDINEIKDYHFCRTAYYPEIKFTEWGANLHKPLQYRIAEDLGFESPAKMAEYFILNYKDGFSGQIISFKNVNY